MDDAQCINISLVKIKIVQSIAGLFLDADLCVLDGSGVVAAELEDGAVGERSVPRDRDLSLLICHDLRLRLGEGSIHSSCHVASLSHIAIFKEVSSYTTG